MPINKIYLKRRLILIAGLAVAGSSAHAFCGLFFTKLDAARAYGERSVLSGAGPAWKESFDRLKTIAVEDVARKIGDVERSARVLWDSYYKAAEPPRKRDEFPGQLSAAAVEMLDQSGRRWTQSRGDGVVANLIQERFRPYMAFTVRKNGFWPDAPYIFERAQEIDQRRMRDDFLVRASLFLHDAGDETVDHFGGKRNAYFAEIAYRYLLLAPYETFAIDFLQALHLSATGETYQLRNARLDRAIGLAQSDFVAQLADDQL